MADTSYEALLSIAIEAAREAGDLLRQDFLRPGGPRGHVDKAEADEPAEWIIRNRLLAATPDWGYVGEETGSVRIAGSDAIWLVDPNDGTEAYLKSWRGSAVSIGLIVRGEPVLGVVNAFAAPDNEGDLFTWARGGPLLRNGQPVEPPAWQEELSRQSAVIVSQSADHAVRENLACLHPSHYLTATSIAYRLALVATGEGDACTCLSHPGNWDYAGGHALLAGAGGVLVDENGVAVTYGPQGESQTEWCFGGAPGIVARLPARDWWSVQAAQSRFVPERFNLAFSPAEPVPGETEADNGRLRRAQGCWLGQLAGDALGSMVEFLSADEIRRRYPEGLTEFGPSPVWKTLAGQPTDDSELALMLARTLLRDGGYHEEEVCEAYLRWYGSQPFDVGNTIGRALHAASRREHGSRAQAARRSAVAGSEANGALMRQSPLAIWGHALAADSLARIVRSDTTLTHPREVCCQASETFVTTLAAVVEHGLSGEDAYRLAREWVSRYLEDSPVRRALDEARERVPDYERNPGHVLVALQNAFFQALRAESFAEGVRATVMVGGDSDTNGAVAGALLGAIHGAPAVPAPWRRALLTCRPLEGVAGIFRPRPRAFWPVDAYVLAERLLFAGTRAV
jgi:ADP-ribosylglycohydrolase/fructose-1,6-bisphosphatase/inositol monophosphatase family enzyme